MNPFLSVWLFSINVSLFKLKAQHDFRIQGL